MGTGFQARGDSRVRMNMSESSPIQIGFRDEDGFTTYETLAVQRLDNNEYLVEESAAFGDIRWRDIVELSPTPDGKYLFEKVLQKSGFDVGTFVLSRQVIESQDLKLLLDYIVSIEGNWEIVYGGVLFTHLPPESDLKIEDAIQLIARKPQDAGSV